MRKANTAINSVYLDLVDTNNGNAYVTMGAGQKMKIYWPVPADAKADTEFHIVHFVGLDRDADVDMSDLWTTHIPEEMKGKKVTVDGYSFVEFSVSSFSPFALLYEKDGTATPNPDQTPDPAPNHSFFIRTWIFIWTRINDFQWCSHWNWYTGNKNTCSGKYITCRNCRKHA